ncbi:MAG: NAD(P)/FAD-dependent oxidoreductase [Acidobacteriota bacterium]
MPHDAIIIGAGHNGLAAGVILAQAGWKVLILERNEQPGGAVQTAEVTLPGFRHDLFAANLNLFAGSPFFEEFQGELREHGLEFVQACKPFGSVFEQGGFVGVSTDPEETLQSIGRISPQDALAWQSLYQEFQRSAGYLFPLLAVPMPSFGLARGLWKGMRKLGRRWPLDLLRLLVQSPREFLQERFESPQVQALCAAWGMHLDFPPAMAGGALFAYLESMAGQMNGMALGKGGADSMIKALVSLFESLGGELRCRSAVGRIRINAGGASGVATEGGRSFGCRNAVIANLTPTVLAGLLEGDALSRSERRRIGRYRYGPGTMMVHLALSGLPDWEAGEHVQDFAYVHIGTSLEEMDRTYSEAISGLLPEHPTLVVGQPTAVDPSRAPQGSHILWVQVRALPAVIAGDTAGKIGGRDWETAGEPYAERVLDRLERFAPGLRGKILGRCILSPADLQSRNPNLVGGDNLGGSHHLSQNYLLRPFPGWSRYRTPIDRLYMCGASTWPGAGVGAGSGRLLAKMLTGRISG